MTGMIDKEGILYLKRRGKMTQQLCPHSGQPCGDHCPFFEEPRDNRLTICRERILLGIQDDRREFTHQEPRPERKLVVEKNPRKVIRYWIRDDEETLRCPDCATIRKTAGFSSYKPRTCKNCHAQLTVEEI